MKRAAFGISITSLLIAFSPALAQEAPAPDEQASAAQPASVESIRQKIEALNSAPSEGVQELVRLSKAGLDQKVLDTYVQNSRLPEPSPRDIVYLHDQGVPEDVINSLIRHGREMRDQARKEARKAAKQQAAAAGNAQSAAPAQTVPPYTYDTQGYTYNYPQNNVVIIPYNPYRSYYRSYYSPPFYGLSYPYYPWYSCQPPWAPYAFNHRPYGYYSFYSY